jgi:hypothetical protein
MLEPKLPDYDHDAWAAQPFSVRLQWICQAWAADGYGTPLGVYALYALKIGFHLAMWAWFCTFTPGFSLAQIGTWWAETVAFQKMILWTLLFEGLGLGCGSGPLTGRYLPPLGGALHFFRPGTTKLPLWPGLPVIGGHRRTALDVAAYAAAIGVLLSALTAAEVLQAHWVALAVLLPLLGLLDKTIFLAFRSEHYLSVAICMLAASDWIAGSKWVWMAIWLWAALSKATHHFPAVMCVMTSNAPWTRFTPLRRLAYRNYPHDLRPSTGMVWYAHVGTMAEFALPLLLVWSGGGPLTLLALVGLTVFHLFIAVNVPMGVPLEWNFVMIYGAWVLFGVHADVALLGVASPWLWAWILGMHGLVPLVGSVRPAWVSFLLTMRYYAGNWAYSVWLFRDNSIEKLDRGLVKAAMTPKHQLGRLYGPRIVDALIAKVTAFRCMHLLGRALRTLLPRAVDDVEAYEWLDGELVAGLALGWNFGDGHLHHHQLLAAIQAQCAFEPGELRVITVESQPIHRQDYGWAIHDAHDGLLARGTGQIAALRQGQPWEMQALPGPP